MSSEKMNTDVAPGDKVSWSWGSGNPSGKVEEVQPHDVTITTHKGNEVKKSGSDDNPAVKLSLGGEKSAVKQASEVDVEKEGPKHDQAGSATTNSAETNGTSVANKKKKEGSVEAGQAKGAKAKAKSKGNTAAPKKDEKKEGKADEKAEEKTEDKAEPDDKDKAESKAEEKKDDAKEEDKAEKEEEKEPEKKKPGRKVGAPAKPKAEKPKKRAATETGEPRRSKRGKPE